MAVCLDIKDGGNAHVDVGFLYDSAVFTMTGPTRFTRVPEQMTVDPCMVTTPVGGTPIPADAN